MDNNTLSAMMRDPSEFRRVLLIDTDTGPRPLASAADPWQVEDFTALDPGWRRVAGHQVDDAIRRAYLERARGHSKTADLAAMASWVLFSSRRQLSGIAAAADQDQASLLRDAVNRLVLLNPWLADFLTVQKHVIVNEHTGSELTIIASDAASSYGLTPDFVIVDEVTHWGNDGLWVSLFSAAAKRAACMLVIIANAGTGRGKSWQWGVREAARTGDDWYFHRLGGPAASWITPDRLAEQERMLPPLAYERLWQNRWTTGSGDALTEGDNQAAIVRDGPMYQYEAGHSFVGAIDLGIKHDHSAFVVLAADHATHKVKLASCESWRPPAGGEVQVADVFNAVIEARWKFGMKGILYDPWQGEYLAQNLREQGIGAEPKPFIGQNLNAMARPIPEAAPVIMAFLPSREMSSDRGLGASPFFCSDIGLSLVSRIGTEVYHCMDI